MHTQADREVHVRGGNGPVPILRTRNALNDMAADGVVRMLAATPATARDFRVLAMQAGSNVVAPGRDAGAFWFMLRRK